MIKQLTLLTQTNQPDGMGGIIQEWNPAGSLTGILDMISGSNQNIMTQNAILEQSTHMLMTDYREDLNDAMRILDHKGRVYSINYIDDPVGIGHHLEIYLTYVEVKP